MADTLSRIVARKREEVAARADDPLPRVQPTQRSLRDALARPGARFIMEVKPKSPSGHVAKHDSETALAAYRPVADAISVLTDEEDFGGSPDLLARLRREYGGPILAKDFIVDPRQVNEARGIGADAVLAMLSVLDDEGARAVIDRARELAMDVLVEVHDEAELDRALALGATIVGINNRDLKTLKTDLAVTERMAARVPDDVLLVSESGIASHEDVARLSPLVDAFLVGSHLMASDNIAWAARTLVHGPVKLCGMTDVADIALAARMGASHVGFILVEESPRYLSVDRARTLAMMAREFGMKTVGVMRGQSVEDMTRIARTLKLDIVQLHERSAADTVAALREALPDGTAIWALAGVGGRGIDPPTPGAERTIFDTIKDGRTGGTGAVFDWGTLEGREDLADAFLAGGITPDNARAARAIGAYGLDTCSGVESVPGTKDPAKVEALFAALRPTDRRQT